MALTVAQTDAPARLQCLRAGEQRHRDVWGLPRLAAAFIAALIVKASELGRIVGHLQR